MNGTAHATTAFSECFGVTDADVVLFCFGPFDPMAVMTMFALDGPSGKLLWQASPPYLTFAGAEAAPVGLLVAPGVSTNLAFVYSQSGWLQVDVAKGQVTTLPATLPPLVFQVPWPSASGALSMASGLPIIYL